SPGRPPREEGAAPRREIKEEGAQPRRERKAGAEKVEQLGSRVKKRWAEDEEGLPVPVSQVRRPCRQQPAVNEALMELHEARRVLESIVSGDQLRLKQRQRAGEGD